MSRKFRLLLRLIGILIIAVALLGNLPGSWAVLVGLVGVVMFFAGGPT